MMLLFPQDYAIDDYRLDGLNPNIRASGLNVVDLSATYLMRSGFEFSAVIDNATDSRYYEKQNYFQSRTSQTGPALERIHGTPGYPIGVTLGLTYRFR